MIVHFEPRHAEFMEGRLAEFRVRRRALWLFCWGWGSACVVAGGAGVAAWPAHPAGYIVSGVGVAALLYVLLFVRLLASAEWRTIRAVRVPVDLRLDVGTIVVDTLLGARRLDRADATLIETDHVFVVCHRGGSEIIPKRALTRTADMERLRHLLAADVRRASPLSMRILFWVTLGSWVAASVATNVAIVAGGTRSPSEVVNAAQALDRHRIVVTGEVVKHSTWTSPRGVQFLLLSIGDGQTGLQLLRAGTNNCRRGDLATASGTFYRFRVVDGRTFYNMLAVDAIDCGPAPVVKSP